MVTALEGRRVLAVDLPGHGESCHRDSYDMGEVVEVVHAALLDAGAHLPILVGHSLGAVLATAYAGRHPTRAVLNIDQPLLPGPFGDYLRSVEPVLRGPEYLNIWDTLSAGMGADQLAPHLRTLLRSDPRQDLLLGYWSEILQMTPTALRAERTQELTALREAGTAYHHVSRAAMPPGYREWFNALLPEAAFTVLPGSGHFPHVGQPQALARIVSDFSDVHPMVHRRRGR